MTTEELAARFNAVSDKSGHWMAKCPAHPDKNGSLSITAANGKTLINCLAGCDVKEVLAKAGLTLKDLYVNSVTQNATLPFRYGLTLKEYCDAKRLDPAFLASVGVTECVKQSKSGNKNVCLKMLYMSRQGTVLAIRYRMMLSSPKSSKYGWYQKFLWESGSQAKSALYGYWLLSSRYWQEDYPRQVLLVEGESDCHALWQNGFGPNGHFEKPVLAMGLPGAGMYKPETNDNDLNEFDTVYVHIEKDAGGQKLYRSFESSSIRAKVRFFCLAGYKDPSEAWQHLAGERDGAQTFRNLMANGMLNARPFETFEFPPEMKQALRGKTSIENGTGKNAGKPKAVSSAENGKLGGRPPADYMGVVRAFAERHRDANGVPVLRYWRNAWYAYNGHCYKPIANADMENGAMAFLQNEEVASAYHVQPTANAVKNILMGLRSSLFCGIPTEMGAPSWLSSGKSADGWVATGNVIINIEAAAKAHLEAQKNGHLPSPVDAEAYTRELTPDMLSTFALPYEYNQFAQCPKFDAWLASTLPDPALQTAVRMLMGLALVPDTSYNVCFFLAGEAGTGKSTFLEILLALVGEDNVCRVPLLKFEEKFSIWPLAESLLNIVGEMPTDDPQGRLRYIEGDFKDSISGGMLSIEKKGKDVCKARCTARHVFATNSLPVFFDKSDGIWDRLIIIPFEQRFRGETGEVRNISQDIITNELPGILCEALVGLGLLRQYTRFPEPEACRIAKQHHRERCDFDASYLRDTYCADSTGEVELASAYKSYSDTLRDNGLGIRSSPTFQQAVYRIFGVRPVKRSPTDFKRVFKGISKNYGSDMSASKGGAYENL